MMTLRGIRKDGLEHYVEVVEAYIDEKCVVLRHSQTSAKVIWPLTEFKSIELYASGSAIGWMLYSEV